MLAHITLGMRATSRNFSISTRVARQVWIIWVQLLEGPPQQNLGGQNMSKNSMWLLTSFDFDHKYPEFLACRKSMKPIDWLIEHGLTSAPTQYRLYGRQFLQVWWPNQQCQSTEGGWLVIQTGLSLTRLISPCYNNTTCMQNSEWTQWDEAKSGRQNLWAAQMTVQLQKATQYHY